MGLDRLIDAIADIWDSLLPWVVIDQTEAGLVMRLGKYNRRLEPGFHWVIPFFESVEADDITTRVESMVNQSLTTRDGKKILVSVNIQWRINDFVGSVLKIQEIEEAIPLACAGVVFSFIKRRDWIQLEMADPDHLNDELKELCRKRVQRYGALVEETEFKDLSQSRTYRITND